MPMRSRPTWTVPTMQKFLECSASTGVNTLGTMLIAEEISHHACLWSARCTRKKGTGSPSGYSGKPTFFRSALNRGSPRNNPGFSRSARSRNHPIRIGPSAACESNASKARSLSPRQDS